MISGHSGGCSYFPRFNLISPERILRAVLLPMPFWPKSPSTPLGEGSGKRKSLNVLAPKRWLHSPSSSSGKLTTDKALKGHFRTHIPQPTQRDSTTMGLSPSNRIASILLRTGGQN